MKIKNHIDLFLEKNNKEFFSFILIFIAIFSSVKLSTGPGSNGNVEQWINLTNQLFYGKQDLLFSYGPLYWLTGGPTLQNNIGGTASQYNIYTYWLTIAFLSTLNALFWSLIFTPCFKARTYIFFGAAFLLFFNSLVFYAVFFLWPFAFIAHWEFSQREPINLKFKSTVLLGIFIGFIFYVRYFYGFIALVTFGAYFFGKILDKENRHRLITLLASVAISYVLFGSIIFHNSSSLLNYITINNQLNFGNSVDMTLNVKNFREVFIKSGIALLILNVYFALNRKYLLFLINSLFIIFFKIGFSRADHYIEYFVIPIAILSLGLIFERSKLGCILFSLLMVNLYSLASSPSFPGSPTKNALQPSVNFAVDYATRMRDLYQGFKLDANTVRKIGQSTVDVYPYNNEYMFANELNYWRRPLFQSYMTLTPALDSMNQHFYESPDRPRFILWTAPGTCSSRNCNTFSDFDQKFILNEDPLTTSAILLNYQVVGVSYAKNSFPIMLLEQRQNIVHYSDSLITTETMRFGKWYAVPEVQAGIIKIIPKFKFTLYGKAKNLLFRGNAVTLKYRLISGEIREYRLNLLNSRSGIWVSPLPDNFSLNGTAVDSIMFEVHKSHYLVPTFKAKWINVPISTIHTKKSIQLN